jgi:hypothetical protein
MRLIVPDGHGGGFNRPIPRGRDDALSRPTPPRLDAARGTIDRQIVHTVFVQTARSCAVFSLNVPLPPAVGRLAETLRAERSAFDRVRDRHTLVCKRFGADDVANAPTPPSRPDAFSRLREDLRPLLADMPPFEAAITGIDAFERPASGTGPVVYLAVESDALVRLHRRLCAAFDPVPAIEGDAYVPHVTLARGGSPDAAKRAVGGLDEPIRWRAHALDLYDPEFREVAATIAL